MRREHAGQLEEAIRRLDSLEPVAVGGRGVLWRFIQGGEAALIRRYRRGGVTAGFMPRDFILVNRPLGELRTHHYAYRQGLPVAEPLGAVWGHPARGRREGFYVSRELRGASLLQALTQRPEEREPLLEEAGRVIRAMHDAGVVHGDLNGGNVFMDAAGKAYLLDFDQAYVQWPLKARKRARNLLRFRRSLFKNGHGPEAFEWVLAGYGGLEWPRWLDWCYRIRGGLSDMVRGRTRAL
ncbi:MAG: lipopolysaccharide kinase InaA family protein [Candidatus Hydrogenedentota bacterium]